MEQTYGSKEIIMPELLDASAEAHTGETIDIYEHTAPPSSIKPI